MADVAPIALQAVTALWGDYVHWLKGTLRPPVVFVEDIVELLGGQTFLWLIR